MTSLLQTSDGDIAITNGRGTLVDGPAEKAQKIRNAFKLFEGEFFLDTRQGVPWFDAVFVKNPDLGVIQRLFERVVLSVPGILEASVDLQWDHKTRELSYTFKATDDEGKVIEGGAPPFIVRAE